MALIPCPHCGKEVSSYAKRCPKCNGELSPQKMDVRNMVVCSECGSPYNNKLSVCPSCGKPTAFQNAESVKRKKHRNVIIAAIVVAAIGVGLGLILKNNADRKEAAQQEMLNAQRRAEDERVRMKEENDRIEKEERQKRQVPQWLLGEWEKDETQIDPSTYDIITLTLVVTSDGYKVTQSRSNGGTYSLGSQRWEGYRTEGHTVYTDNGSVQFSYDESKKQLTYSNATWHKRW